LTQEDFEPRLSFVEPEDDNKTILLNGNPDYSLSLPLNLSKKNYAERRKTVKSVIYNGCTSFGLHYVSDDNVTNLAKEVVDQLYERARVTKNYVAPPAHPIIVNEYKNDYFEFLIDCIKRTVKEESALIRQIMYTILSGYTHDPTNLGVLAPTSTGKSYPIMQSVDFTPRGKEIRIVGSMTPKVLIREQGVLVDKEGKPIGKDVRRLRNAISEAKAAKKLRAAEEYQDELAALLDGSAYIIDLSNKTLIFLEPPHQELWSLLKPILSHDYWEMEHPFVDKIAGGGLEVKRVITRGFPACIFCSARDESKWEMWEEIESRFMPASPNMVKPKYEAGNKLIAQRKGLPRGVKQQIIISDEAKELGKKSFLYLKHQIQQYTSTTDSPVWIPFGERLAEILPADKGQDNRATNRFFTMLNMIALSKAHLRYRLIFDDEELVIATLEDLQEALHVMQNMSGLPPHKLKFYKQHILPLYRSKKVPLETRDICDFYNANNPKGTPRMNSDNLRKNYLQELVNHNYLEQERDESTKAIKYLYTPLVDVEEEREGEEEKQSSTSPTLGQVFQKLHFSKLLLPENHPGIPQDWLKKEISQLSDRRLTNAPLKIFNAKGNDIPIDDFIRIYENKNSLRLTDFLKGHRLVGCSNSVNITTPKPQNEDVDVNITGNKEQEDEKRKTEQKVGQVYDLELVNKAMGDKGYCTEQDFVFVTQMEPNLHWTETQAEQTFHALIEGKIVEFEPGKFKPMAAAEAT
jgi:hypothetical protein